MKVSHLTSGLLGLTVVLQLMIFYMSWRTPWRADRMDAPPVERQVIRDAPANTFIDISGLPSQGDDHAPLLLIEFSDFECPFCKKHATAVLSELKERFVSTGKIRYLIANNPLAMHANAEVLAGAAICAGLQHRYWDIHDLLFTKEPRSRDAILAVAKEADLDLDTYTACLDDRDRGWSLQLERELKIVRALGVSGTPAFALGRPDSLRGGNNIHVEKILSGAQPFETFSEIINDALKGL